MSADKYLVSKGIENTAVNIGLDGEHPSVTELMEAYALECMKRAAKEQREICIKALNYYKGKVVGAPYRCSTELGAAPEPNYEEILKKED